MITSTPFGVVTLKDESGNEFKVNGQRLKHYLGGSVNEVNLDFKREKNSVEKKIIYSNCLAKDIKLSSFLGGNSSRS